MTALPFDRSLLNPKILDWAEAVEHSRDAEIRSLNDALTAANERAVNAELALAAQRWTAGYVEQIEADLRRERANNVEQGQHVDALMGKVARLEDKRGNVALTRAHTVMREFVKQWAKEIEGSYSNLEKQDAWRAMLAEIAGGGK